MSKNRSTLQSLYGSSGSSFPDNTTGSITEATERTFGQDLTDSHFNLNDDAYTGAKGTKSGVNTISGLKGIVTAGVQLNIFVLFRDTGSSNILRIYELVSGTDAESSPDIIRPTDYDGTSNQKVWKLCQFPASAVSSFNSRTGAVTPASGDYTASQVTGAESASNKKDGLASFNSTDYLSTKGAGNAFDCDDGTRITHITDASTVIWDWGGKINKSIDWVLDSAATTRTISITNVIAQSYGKLIILKSGAPDCTIKFATYTALPALSTFTNVGSGTSWTTGSSPHVTISSAFGSSKYLAAAFVITAGVPFILDIGIGTVSVPDWSLVSLDSSNVLVEVLAGAPDGITTITPTANAAKIAFVATADDLTPESITISSMTEESSSLPQHVYLSSGGDISSTGITLSGSAGTYFWIDLLADYVGSGGYHNGLIVRK